MKEKSIAVMAALGLLAFGALGFAQEQAAQREAGDSDLHSLLTEKERRYLNDNGSVEDLTDAEIEHVQRIQRLRQLRTEAAVITEAAGADRPDEPQPIVIPEPANTTNEDATELARENAVLRAEVRRLRAQLRAIDRESQELLYRDSEYFYQPQERRFYLPIR